MNELTAEQERERERKKLSEKRRTAITMKTITRHGLMGSPMPGKPLLSLSLSSVQFVTVSG